MISWRLVIERLYNFYFFMGILAVSGMLSALIADFFITPLLFKRFKIFGEEE